MQPVRGTLALCSSGDCETPGDPSVSPGLQGPGRWHRELPARGWWVCGCAPGSFFTQHNHVLPGRSEGLQPLCFSSSADPLLAFHSHKMQRLTEASWFRRALLAPRGVSAGCRAGRKRARLCGRAVSTLPAPERGSGSPAALPSAFLPSAL